MDRSRPDASANDATSIDSLACGLAGGKRVANGHWGAFAVEPEASEQTRWLARTIETEIIPRLMLAHRAERHELFDVPQGTSITPTAQQIDEFAQLTFDADPDATLAYVRALRASGVALDVIYLDLLAPAARRLGALWEADLCGFTEVTLGLWRLQQVMRELGGAFQDQADVQVQPKRAILVPVPGSQHTMGLFMVAEFFRRAGWDVWGDSTVSASEIVAAARGEWFDLVGISVSTESQVAALASVILDVRKASRNRSLLVIIGGPIVASNPDLVSLVGADATAEDAPQAVLQAESLLAERSVAS